MADEDPFYNRDTIAMLKPRSDGPWSGRASKLAVLKAQIEEHAAPGAPPALLSRVNEALARLDAGVYHLCARCGRKVSEDRDRVESPWLVDCAACRAAVR